MSIILTHLLSYSTSHTDSRFVSLSVTHRFGKMELRSMAKEGELGN